MISVIINTKNEEQNIGRCLESIRRQTDADFEVIVVDNRSSDQTVGLAQKFGAQVFDFGPERSEQKNFGAQKAGGAWLLFVDADMELSPKVLSDCMGTARQGFDALVVPEKSLGDGFWAQCRALEKRMYFNDARVEAPRFFSREIFTKVGGYSAGMISGEDWDLREKVKRAGGKIGRAREVIYHHEGRVNLTSAFKKKFYYSKNAKIYLAKNPPKLGDLFLFVVRPSFIKNIKYAFFDPMHYVGVFVLKSVEFFAGFLGLIFS